MSVAFSDFDNTVPSQNLIGTAFTGLGYNSGRLEFLPATEPKGQGTHDLGHFRAQLDNVRSRFNLDQSEAARRIFIDLFIAEALIGASRNAIVTTEYNISADPARLGHGRLDYLISSIDSAKKVPIYFPSIVIEAKKDLLKPDNATRENGQWQLLSELLTLVQLSGKKKPFLPPFLRGIFTDGRYWNFIEVSLNDPKGNPYVMRSGRIDIVNANNQISDKATVVQNILQYWLANYSEQRTALSPKM
ncbi:MULTISPECIES: hypothetical protein [unclassified Mesorhizobium]|uniref:hypothetical protein n=1 Tax=unclassified Mesorhizobium TaxID=325217 RepID=UPI00112C6E73|nr:MULTISPECIES: hypothetical protein [unclassified Mesorhizobium]TPK93180.1 hypothetical protein FJ567_26840 [Mesorhizobium sp. B2-4-16]TPL73232.1 hypothetical protein FJ956_10365 [Mesorhizobium sp. B2-4-3]